jgi:hypothetical protein
VRAASTSAKIRGKNSLPSTHGSIANAVDQAKCSGASRGPNASVARCAPAGVTASGGGGQQSRRGVPSTRRWTATEAAATATIAGALKMDERIAHRAAQRTQIRPL